MSYSNPTKGKGGPYYPQQHQQHRLRYPEQQKPGDISPRQPRFSQPQTQRPQHPGQSQSPRIPSPSVSPVAVNPLPHDMSKQGAPNRPGMAASPQQGILQNAPNHGVPQPMLNVNQVRFQAPRVTGAPQRFQQQVPQQVFNIRHQTPPHMAGMQAHHQPGAGPQAQQGANTAQLMQSNAAAQGPYMQGQQYIMAASPVPIQVQQIPQQHRQFQPPYQQMFQPTTSQYYSSPPQQVYFPPAATQSAQRPQFQPVQQQSTTRDSKRNRNIIRIVDPSTNQDVTDSIIRDASGSSSPPSGRSSANVTPPVSTSSEDAKRIQAQFAARVAMVASDIPTDMPAPHRPAPTPQQIQPGQQPQAPQAALPQQIPGQEPQAIPGQPPQQIVGQPPQALQQPMVLPQVMGQGVPPAQVPGGGVVPIVTPGIAPAATAAPQAAIPSQPQEPAMPEPAQVTVVAATPGAEASQPKVVAAPVQPIPKAAAPVDPAALQQQQQPIRVPVVPQVVPAPQPVAVANAPPPAQNPAPVPAPVPAPAPAPAQIGQVSQPPPTNIQSVPPVQDAPAPAKETPAVATQDSAKAPAAAGQKVAESAPAKALAAETQSAPVTSEPKDQPDAGKKEEASTASAPVVKPEEPVQPVAAPETQEAAYPVEGKDSKKKSQKKRLQELDSNPSKDSDEFAAYKVDEAQKEPAPEKPKELDTTSAPEAAIPKKESTDKTEQSEKPTPTTQQPAKEEAVPSEKTTEAELSDVAKRKSEDDALFKKPADVVQETTPAKQPDAKAEEKVDRNEVDETVNEADIVESENSKNKDPKDDKAQLKYTYRDEQWSPINPDGKKQYDRDFLLQFQGECKDKPKGLPHIPDIVLDKADIERPMKTGMSQKGPDFMPSFMKSPRVGGKQPNFPQGQGQGQGQGRRSSREPLKVIQRVSQSMETNLKGADKAWKPGHKRSEEPQDGDESKTTELFRNFTSILNKLTPQKFSKLVEQAQQLPIDTEERLIGVTNLVFEKAISEPNFSTAYAHMCEKLSVMKVQSQSGVQVQFRPILLHNCQREFEKDQQTEIDDQKRRKEIAQLPADQQAVAQEELEIKNAKAKRRTMGNMRFIGELYKLRILTENIMHDCVMKLLKAKDDDSLECLCNLMATIGKTLDHEKARNRIDQYFTKIDKIIQSKKNPPRIRFLMCDLVDLRRNNWVPRRQEAKPQTIDAIHRDFHLEEAKKQEVYKNYSGPSSRSSREQAPPPRTVTPQANDGWNTVPATSKTRTTTYEPSKMKLTRISTADDNIQLGPGGRGFNMWTRGSSGGSKNKPAAETASSGGQEEPPQANRFSMLSEDAKQLSRGSRSFDSRDSRGRNQSPISKRSSRDRDREREREKESAIAEVQKMRSGGRREIEPRGSREISRPEKQEPTMPDDKVEQKSKAIVDEFLNLRDFTEAKKCVSELPSKQRHLFVSATVDHIIEKNQDMREGVGVLFQTLIACSLLTNEQYLSGLSGVIEFAEDMAIDIPKIWEYLGEIQGAMLDGGSDFLTLQATAIKPLYELKKAGILLAEILRTASRRKGASEVCHIWRSSNLKWEDFLSEGEDVQEFVQRKGVAFTLDGATMADNGLNSAPAQSDSSGDWLHTFNRGLTSLLNTSKPDNNTVLDWIELNVSETQRRDSDFIRALVTMICQNTAEGEGQTCRIDPENLKNRCLVLRRYIDNKRPLEVQALYAVQALNHSLQNPPGLLGIIFDVLYDEDVIPEEAFYDWKKSEDQKESAGKGVALKSVTSFFTWLTEAD